MGERQNQVMRAAGEIGRKKGLPTTITPDELGLPNWPVTVYIDGMVPPSKNEWERQYRHWAAKRDFRLMWASVLDAQLNRRKADLKQLKDAAKLKTPVLLTVKIMRNRLLDDTAIYAGFEPIKDVLTARHKDGIGWIADDSPTLCTTRIQQIKAERTGTEISIEPR